MLKSATLLLCAVIAVLNSADLIGTEFGAGRLTGSLVWLCLCGAALFFVGSALAFGSRDGAALVGAAAALICAPLYAYRIAPWSLRWLSEAPSSVAAPDFTFDPLAAAGLLSLVVMVLGRRPPTAKAQC